MTKRSIIAVVAGLALSVAAAANAQIQTKAQQKCIFKINKDAIKTQAAQGKVNSGCIKDYVKGKISGPTAAEDCIQNDVKNKVGKKQAKILKDETKKCTPLPAPPDFAYTSGVFAGTSAAQAEISLVRAVFGNPLDDGMYICDTFPNECKCQRLASKRVNKLFRTASQIFVKCKKFALRVGKIPFPLGANSAADIADCVTDLAIESVGADAKGKIAQATGQLGDTIGQFCGQGGEDEFGAGVCTGLSGAPLRDCIAAQTLCHFCEMVNAIDNLSINCTTWSGTACSIL
jgi:hypothetical protein